MKIHKESLKSNENIWFVEIAVNQWKINSNGDWPSGIRIKTDSTYTSTANRIATFDRFSVEK